MIPIDGAIPPVAGSIGRIRQWGIVACLVLLSSLLFFHRLGSFTLFDADEPAFAESAREMLESGDWITPRFNFQPRFDKPILFYWLIVLAYKGFGVGEFAARFWSAVFAVGLVVSLYVVGRQMLSQRGALVAALAFAANMETAVLARAAVTDMTLAFFMTWSLFCFFAVARASGTSSRAVLAGYLAMALAVLTKGPIGLLIPVLVIVLFLVVRGRVGETLHRFRLSTGLLLFAAVALPWYLMALRVSGWDFIQGFFVKHHLIRFTGVISGHRGPWYFFLPVVLIGFFPWSGLLPGSIGDLWRARTKFRRELSAREELLLFLWLWFGIVFVFFSLSVTKLPSYIFPAFPALALLAGAEGESLLGKTKLAGTKWTCFDWLLGGIGCLLAAGCFLLPWIVGTIRPLIRLGHAPYALGVVFLLGSTVAVVARRKGRGDITVAAMAATVVLGILLAIRGVVPAVQEHRETVLRQFADSAARQLGPTDSLVTYDLNAPSLVFYSRRAVGRVERGQEAMLRALAASDGRLLVVAKAASEPRLRQVEGIFLLDRQGGYALYSNRAVR